MDGDSIFISRVAQYPYVYLCHRSPSRLVSVPVFLYASPSSPCYLLATLAIAVLSCILRRLVRSLACRLNVFYSILPRIRDAPPYPAPESPFKQGLVRIYTRAARPTYSVQTLRERKASAPGRQGLNFNARNGRLWLRVLTTIESRQPPRGLTQPLGNSESTESERMVSSYQPGSRMAGRNLPFGSAQSHHCPPRRLFPRIVKPFVPCV